MNAKDRQLIRHIRRPLLAVTSELTAVLFVARVSRPTAVRPDVYSVPATYHKVSI